MADIPLVFLVHRVTVKPLTGTSSSGDVFGAEREMVCLREATSKLIRNPVGEEKLISSTLFTSPGETLREKDLVMFDGKPSRVVEVLYHTDGGLGAWQHLEVLCG